MTEHITKKCNAAGHPEAKISVRDDSGLSVNWLCEYFESEVAKGRRFRASETVQIGWMITQLKANSSGVLELWEPDFDSMPIKWCYGANNTLRHLALQRAVCQEFGCEPTFPSLQEAAVVGRDFLESSGDFMMSRDEPVGADSGWLARCFGSDNDEGIFKSLYEIALHRSCVIPFLALPVGVCVRRTEKMLELSSEEREVTSRTSGVLQRILRTTIFV